MALLFVAMFATVVALKVYYSYPSLPLLHTLHTQKKLLLLLVEMVIYYTTFYSVHNQSGKVTSMFLVKIPTFFVVSWVLELIFFSLTVMPLHPRPSCLSTLMVMLNAKDHCCYKSVLITLPVQNTNIIVDGVCALIILTHYKLY